MVCSRSGPTETISTGADLYKADGDGRYDIKLLFNNGGSAANRFTAGEYLAYDIGGIPDLAASDFAYLSTPAGGAGPFYAAAHVQRIGAGSLSGWIAPKEISTISIPEPAATVLLIFAVWPACRWSRRMS